MKIIDSHIPYGRKGNNKPTRIVVHAMGEYISNGITSQHAVAFLNEYELSAHVLVSPDGVEYRCRYDDEIAYHARGYNTDSLGIEFLVQGSHNYESFINRIKTPYTTDVQMQLGINVVRRWVDLHDIVTLDKHSSLSPDRKVDPGVGFNWDYFLNEVRI